MSEDRATSAEIELRITMIAEMLVMGAKRREVLDWVKKKQAEAKAGYDGEGKEIPSTADSWDVSVEMIDLYLTEARNRITESGRANVSEKLGFSVERLEVLFREMYRDRDFKGCVKALEALHDLLGMKEAQKINLNIDEPMEIDLLPPRKGNPETIKKEGD
jgi:hypothetical protein